MQIKKFESENCDDEGFISDRQGGIIARWAMIIQIYVQPLLDIIDNCITHRGNPPVFFKL